MREVSFLGKFLRKFASTVLILVLSSAFIAGLALLIIMTSSDTLSWFFIILILGVSFITSLVGTGIKEIRSEKGETK